MPKSVPSLLITNTRRFLEHTKDLEFPIPTKALVEAAKISRVVFCKIPMDATLVGYKTGFEIYVGCREHKISDLTRAYENYEKTASLPNRIRFTIAHEIAHTFFYKHQNPGAEKPKLLESLKRTKVWSDLPTREAFCNRTAGRILIPKAHFIRSLQTETFNIEWLKKVYSSLSVSPDVFLIRLNSFRNFFNLHNFRGGIVLLELSRNEWTIRRYFMSDLPYDKKLSELIVGKITPIPEQLAEDSSYEILRLSHSQVLLITSSLDA